VAPPPRRPCPFIDSQAPPKPLPRRRGAQRSLQRKMFSKMSSNRFEQGKESVLGPGSYEIPTTLDDHAPLIVPGSERFPEGDPAGLQVYEDAQVSVEKVAKVVAKPSPAPRASSTKGRRRSGALKENNSGLNTVTSKIDPKTEAKAGISESFELEQLKRRLAAEEKLRAEAEAKAADLAMARKSAANAHAQLQAKEKKLEEVQRKVEDLEAEKGTWKKTLHEKEQAATSLQKSLGQVKSQLDESGQRIEELSVRASSAEQLRREACALRERLAEAERAELELEQLRQREAVSQAPLFRVSQEDIKRDAEQEQEARNTANRIRLDAMERIFSTKVAETEGRLLSLAESQERLHEQFARREVLVAEEREAEAMAWEEKLSEARERLEIQAADLEELRNHVREHGANLAGRLAVREAALKAAVEQQEQETAARLQAESEVARSAAEGADLRRALEEQAAVQTDLEARVEAGAAEAQGLQHELSLWRQRAETAEAECAVNRRRDEELATLERECEEQRRQNRELHDTVRAFRMDLEALKAENHSLREAEQSLRDSLERGMHQQAQLAGHANTNQKIRYTMKLKEENIQLRAELKKAQQRSALIDAGRRDNALLGALSTAGCVVSSSSVATAVTPPVLSGAAEVRARTPSRSQGGAAAMRSPRRPVSATAATGRRTVVTRTGSVAPVGGSAAAAASAEADARASVAEVTRRCQIMERAAERVSVDYQHLLMLVQRAVNVSSEGSSQGDLEADPSSLLERLRNVAAVVAQRGDGDALPQQLEEESVLQESLRAESEEVGSSPCASPEADVSAEF